jgi:hypothetical protein
MSAPGPQCRFAAVQQAGSHPRSSGRATDAVDPPPVTLAVRKRVFAKASENYFLGRVLAMNVTNAAGALGYDCETINFRSCAWFRSHPRIVGWLMFHAASCACFGKFKSVAESGSERGQVAGD